MREPCLLANVVPSPPALGSETSRLRGRRDATSAAYLFR